MIQNGYDIEASDFINNSERNATPANDVGRCAKLESDGKIHQNFIRGSNVVSMTAKENITIGNPIGVSNGISDYVARSFRSVSKTLDIPSRSWSPLPAMQLCEVYFMTGNQFIVIYRIYGGGSGFASQSVWAVAGTIDLSTMSITWGAGAMISEDAGGSMNGSWGGICKVDTNKFIAVATIYTTKYAYVGTISGNTITITSATAPSGLATSAYDWFSGAQLGTNSGVMFMTNGTAGNGRLCSFTVSGTTITWGTTLTTSTLVTGDNIFKVSASSFGCVLKSNGTMYVGSISGGVITLGSGVSVISNFSTNAKPRAEYISDGYVLLSYAKSDTVSNVGVRIISVSGTVPTAGSEVIIGAGATVSFCRPAIKTATTALVIANNKIYNLTFSGSTISAYPFLTKVINLPSSAIDFIYLNGFYLIVPYILSNYTVQYFIEGMANNFIGIAQNTASAGNEVSVLTGGVDENQSGLTAGASYMVSNGALSYVDDDATVNTLDDIYVVKAISATKIII